MIVDVVLRLELREILRGEPLTAWLRMMEQRIEQMEAVESAHVAGDVRELTAAIVDLMNRHGLDLEQQLRV